MEAILLSLLSAAALTWLFVCIGLWIWAAGRVVSGREIVPFEPRPPFPCGIVEILLAVGVFIVSGTALVRMLVPAPVSEAEGPSAATLVPMIVANSAATMTAVAAVLAWAGLAGISFRQMGLVPKWRDLLIGVGAILMLLPPLLMLQAFLSSIFEYRHPLLDVLKQPQPPLTVAVMALSSTVIAPLAEEFFFRGLLQGWLGRLADRLRGGGARESQPVVDANLVRGDAHEDSHLDPYAVPAAEARPIAKPDLVDQRPRPWWPIIASSLVFAAVHIGQGPAPISLFFLSLGLGYVYRQTGRIWPAVILHMGLNGLSTAATIVTTTLAG